MHLRAEVRQVDRNMAESPARVGDTDVIPTVEDETDAACEGQLAHSIDVADALRKPDEFTCGAALLWPFEGLGRVAAIQLFFHRRG
jgi:hypothetical protein